MITLAFIILTVKKSVVEYLKGPCFTYVYIQTCYMGPTINVYSLFIYWNIKKIIYWWFYEKIKYKSNIGCIKTLNRYNIFIGMFEYEKSSGYNYLACSSCLNFIDVFPNLNKKIYK